MFGKQKKLVMCQACRALVEASASACPLCGREAVPSLRARAGAALGGAQSISFIILTINILLFVVMALVEVNNGRGAEAFIQSASGPVLYDFGALSPPAVAAGQWWRLITMNFLHIGLMHLLFNSTALYQIGPQVEEIYGSQKFIVVYIATGLASGVASLAFNIGGAGASGAIFGLIGLMAVYGYREGGTFGRAIIRQMLIWGAIGFMFGAMIGANNAAHAGGFAAGAGLGFIVRGNPPATHRSSSAWSIVAVACIVVLAASFAMAGRNYGEVQKQASEMERRRRQFEAGGQNVILLSEHIHNAQKAWADSIDPQKQEPRQIAEALKKAAVSIERAPRIDEQSDKIRARIVELLNKRASAFDSANNNKPALLQAASADLKETRDAFRSYFEWEESVLENYGLVREDN
ncbi:MAG TPA: rhomboid family intramembrane serine protease [Blastocatellia bacterium]|nr:rhomboid family intramembrane serine protease [Blastocatellia bacterium]